MHDLLDCCKLFPRWMIGTCLPESSQRSGVDNKNGSVVLTFHSDVISNESVINTIKEIADGLRDSLALAQAHVAEWKKYRALWNDDKDAQVEKWISKVTPRVADFDRLFCVHR